MLLYHRCKAMRVIAFIIILLYASASLATQRNVDYLAPMDSDIVMGEKNAPHTIIEYSSLSCPLCGYFHANIFPRIDERYLKAKNAKFIFRHFPIKSVDLKAGAVSLCVPGDKRGVFLDVLFKTQRNWSIEASNPSETLEALARLGGINGDVAKKCLEDKGLEERLIKSREYAQNYMHVNSTPTFIINGKKFDGVVGMDIIEKELS